MIRDQDIESLQQLEDHLLHFMHRSGIMQDQT